MNIVFMGTPDFAVPSLEKILQAGYHVTAVVTAPDRPAGRGRQLRPSPVKAFALEHGLTVLQPEKLRAPEFHEQLRKAAPDLMVVVAFRMLPEVVWSMPKIGTFNLHASLLPDYRGAAPINWVVMNGESKSGATTFLIDKEIDTGNLLLQREIDIPESWNAGDLHDALMVMGAELVLETVQGLEANRLTPSPQDETLYKNKAPKIYKEDCELDWNLPTLQVHNKVRGLSPYPTAWTRADGQKVKIYQSALTGDSANGTKPGQVRIDNLRLYVACHDDWLEITRIQMPGKKNMPVSDFLRGFKGELTTFT